MLHEEDIDEVRAWVAASRASERTAVMRMRLLGWMGFVFACLVCGIGWQDSAHGQSASAPAGQPAPAADQVISVTAKLVEIPSSLPPDDLYDYAYVMRYEVIGGALDKSSILVAHYKPLQARSKIKDKMKAHVGGKLRSFVVGDVHKLKLSGDLKKVWKGPLVDEFAATDRKSIRYWCLQVDPG